MKIILILIFFFLPIFSTSIEAQTCGGTWSCCREETQVRTPAGCSATCSKSCEYYGHSCNVDPECLGYSCLLDNPNCTVCNPGSTTVCMLYQTGASCQWTGSTCGASYQSTFGYNCVSELDFSGCYLIAQTCWGQTCAANEICCGQECGCMPNTQNCSAWQAQGCTVPPGPGDPDPGDPDPGDPDPGDPDPGDPDPTPTPEPTPTPPSSCTDDSQWTTLNCSSLCPNPGQRLQICPFNGASRCFDDPTCELESWFQVSGGNIYSASSQAISISSPIPYTQCEAAPNCIPNLVTEFFSAAAGTRIANTDGTTITGGGEVEFPGSQYSERNFIARGSALTRFRENYEFFYRKSPLGSNPITAFQNPGNAFKPTESGVHYASESINIQEPWTVENGESIVIFVNGNLTIANPFEFEALITVEPGSFLAFIVSGDIIFAQSLGHSNPATTTPLVEGIYIADGSITVQSNNIGLIQDRRFIGAGSFIGWSGINLQRSFSDNASGADLNADRPIELFIYRPDLVVNTPEFMLSSHRIWQETN